MSLMAGKSDSLFHLDGSSVTFVMEALRISKVAVGVFVQHAGNALVVSRETVHLSVDPLERLLW